tara:strand:+ start:29 stop:508 length:480 start_codon:yes stop_codon:yes gene_type:complete
MNFERIDGYPYTIHSVGTILRIHKNKTKELKHIKKQKGYMTVGLYKNGKKKMFQVHRLLAIAFIPNPENKRCVDHINGIRDDNRLENLRWVTNKENLNAFRTPRPISIITKGSITKRKNGNDWKWQYYMSGKKKTTYMKSKEELLKFRIEKLAEYNKEC